MASSSTEKLKKKFKIPVEVEAYLHDGLIARSNMEFEIKLGMLIDRKSYSKYKLQGIREGGNKIIGSIPPPARFATQLSPESFHVLNHQLNLWVKQPDRSPWPFIGYARQQDMDVTYSRMVNEENEKIRITYDLSGKEKPYALKKEALKPKTVYFDGKGELDIRISAAQENQVPIPQDLSTWESDGARVKNRILYQFKNFHIDITEVYGYPDIADEDLKGLVDNVNLRSSMGVDTSVRAFSMTRQEWQLGKIIKATPNKVTIKLQAGGEKVLNRNEIRIEHKGHTVVPVVSYEVEVELKEGILKEESTRNEILHQWISCGFRLKKMAQRPLEAVEHRHKSPHHHKKRRHRPSKDQGGANKKPKQSGPVESKTQPSQQSMPSTS
ncbi:hypothetical protein AAMO2058_001183500 [Amorphochlora amoebiformis]